MKRELERAKFKLSHLHTRGQSLHVVVDGLCPLQKVTKLVIHRTPNSDIRKVLRERVSDTVR